MFAAETALAHIKRRKKKAKNTKANARKSNVLTIYYKKSYFLFKKKKTLKQMTSETQDDRRIWVGNLDTRLTEFQLLKIVQKCGQIEKFDMLFHKNGPLIGQSRGYAFVTYKAAESTTKALHKLNGMYIGKKPLAVRLAKNLNYDDLEKPKPRIEIPALCTRATDSVDSKLSKEDAIRAIEAKLNVLEKRTLDDELEMVSSSSCQTPIIQKYQFNKNNDGTNSQRGVGFSSRTQYVKHRGTSSRPYNRNHRPKRR